MGKITSLITFKGRTGNVVGRKARGYGYDLAMYNPSPNNPNTADQQIVRQRFKVLQRFGVLVYTAIEVGFKKAAVDGMTVLNAFFKSNYGTALTGSTLQTIGIDYTKVAVAKGTLALPYNVAAQAAGTDFTINWTDNSGIGNALATDKCAIVIYNADKEQCITELAAANRSDHTATTSVSSAWTGDKVEVYAFFHGESERDKSLTVSDSLFLGDFTV